MGSTASDSANVGNTPTSAAATTIHGSSGSAICESAVCSAAAGLLPIREAARPVGGTGCQVKALRGSKLAAAGLPQIAPLLLQLLSHVGWIRLRGAPTHGPPVKLIV